MSSRRVSCCLLTAVLLILAPGQERRAQDRPTADGPAPQETPPARVHPSESEGTRSAAASEADDSPGSDAETEARSDVYRPVGFNLFPFYVHELRTSDQAEFLQVMGLYSRTSRPDGTGSVLLLPFFYKQHLLNPPDDRFYIFPLYYQRESPLLSFRYLLPFYGDHRTPDFRMQALFPLWARLSTERGKLTAHHVLYPLFRSTRDLRHADRPVFSIRCGLPYVLEFFELRKTPETLDATAFNLFNWSDETRGPLRLFGSHWVREEWGERGSTHLFPFYWRAAGAESDFLWIVPLFGYSRDGARRDYTLIPLLSRYGRGPGDARRLSVLFPFFQYDRAEEEFTIASYPFFDYHRGKEKSHLGVLFWLYRGYFRASGRRSHNVLYPLSSFGRSADGKRGRNWVVPYFDIWSEKSRYRFLVPLYFNVQRLVEGTTSTYLTFALPSYFSFGAPESYFSLGIPLYWASREGSRGWEVFFPLYYNFYSGISKSLHLIPLFSYVSAPDKKQLFVGGPLYIHERFYDVQENIKGTGHSVLWPFFTVENRDDGFNYRFLPLFWYTRMQDNRGLLVTPFYYQRSGPDGTFRYVFPVYARFQGPRETLDIRAAGAYARHEVFEEDGSPTLSSAHYAWWLATFQRNHTTGATHQRILPLAFWRTDGPGTTRTASIPFYYSHRLVEDDQVHRLRLILGNLYFSKTVERLPIAGAQATSSSGVEPGDLGRSVAENATGRSSPSETAVPESEPAERASDRGVLWPITRWYHDEEGSEGRWFLPFYVRTRTEGASNLALFPLYYSETSESTYDPSYLRYFFLFNRETFAGGSRLSVGQLLFDLRRDEQDDSTRLRLLYPLFEYSKTETSSFYQVTPLITGEDRIGGGERSHSNRVFPIFWEGSVERLNTVGEWIPASSHFFLFPFYGHSKRSTRVDYHLLYPFFHLQRTPESVQSELWPLVFYRRNPALKALRFWPFHATETGETAGDFWVSRYLFLSKYFSKESETSYRLDPFLFRVSFAPERFGIGGLFDTLAYDRSPTRTSFRVIPIAFGKADEDSAVTAFIPFHYRKDYGSKAIDYWSPWRFFFLTSSLKGAGGERHFSVLTKLLDHTYNPERPDYLEYRLLHQFVFYYRSETAKRIEWNPLFQYFHDDTEDRTVFSLLFSLYRRETLGRETRHTLLYFIPF